MMCLERGDSRLLAGQLTVTPRRRRGAEHLDKWLRTRRGGPVEQLLDALAGDPVRMACSHLISFSAGSAICVTA